MNSENGSCLKYIVILAIVGLLFSCGLAQWSYTQQRTQDERFQSVAQVAQEQAAAIEAQANAIEAQAETIQETTHELVTTHQETRIMTWGFSVMAATIAFLVLLVILLLPRQRNRRNDHVTP